MQAAAHAFAQPLLVMNAGTEREIDAAFPGMAQQRVSAVLYGSSTFFQVVSGRLVALAAQQSIPALYEWREFVAAGGLMSYSTSPAESGRQIGTYAGQRQFSRVPNRKICRLFSHRVSSSSSISRRPRRSDWIFRRRLLGPRRRGDRIGPPTSAFGTLRHFGAMRNLVAIGA